MAGSLNRAQLIGHLGADPEIRRTQDGRPIANIRLATSETWRDRNSGERREKTEWHTIVIFNEALAKIAEQYLKKGSKVMVEGQIATRKWQDKNGQDRWSTEIVLQGFNAQLLLLDRSEGSGYRAGSDDPGDYGFDGERASGTTSNSRTQSSGQGGGSFSRDMDDDIPF
ncbi:single-stranded DNA-binding protein [Rhizobium daejeonense]|uniref:Single-stranded DNA-binding protein n=1 Tax=Rhizobium daejeonense TaxID=240521 RepID=A0A6M1SBV9_9HYPH|nr:single-stranded DNA-binding protein [Rhizobium daejeonense]NGO64236.1 single-stranded DNA-binding protein [Rhizobium daejeonense]